jgi:hypothetical protein
LYKKACIYAIGTFWIKKVMLLPRVSSIFKKSQS